MSDISSSLPVKTEVAGDLAVKIVDGLNPAQQMAIDSNGKTSTKISDSSGNAINSTAGSLNVTVSNASIPVSATNLDIRNLTTSRDSVTASIKDANGNPFTSINPLPVVAVESLGDEINNFSVGTAVAKDATSNHDYTVSAGKTMQLSQIEAAASGKMKIEIQVESAVGSNTFTTKFVKFNSAAEPNISVILKEPIAVAAGVKIRVVRTNKDATQDMYSTICGHEI
jgi:hypothetical protein